MEIRKSTTAGVMFWTPAPVHTAPTSCVISEDDEDEQAENEDDFVSQMDENGIIGMAEALKDMRLEETCDLEAECNPEWILGSLNPEEADTSGYDMDSPPEEQSYNLSEHLSHTESPSGDDTVGISRAQTEDEYVRQRKEQKMEYLPERDEYLDMTEEEKDGEAEVKRSYGNRNKNKNVSTSGELRAATDLAESYINNEKISSVQSCGTLLPVVEPAGVSNHHCPIYQSTSPLTSSTFPHLLHFTDEMAATAWIEDETFPDMGLTESLPESHSSCRSLKSSPRCPWESERGELKGLQPAAISSKTNQYSGVRNGLLKSDKQQKQPTPSPRKTRQHSPEVTYSRTRTLSTLSTLSPDRELKTPRVRTSAAELNESRSGALSYPTPDFSKVEPRVRFPKGGYTPPKSKRSSKRDSLSPEPPLVFKSPADIVKEVLLNTTDEPPAPSDCNRPPTNAPNSTVPLEFRCRQQATTLLEQLQEDYNRLLTKYAEAENTIDRLRLEGKVNLYSDPPKPGHSVQLGLSKQASKVMTLNFHQAQRAESSSSSLHPNGHSPHQRSPSSSASISSTRSPGPQVAHQLAKILYSQADKFLQQMETFEDLLNSEKLKPFDQMKGLSQLVQGLDSLERGYLLARDEHKLLQQRGAETSCFDPERELEGLIFQCGLHMDELKEQVEEMRQEQPICEAPPPPPPPLPLQSATSSIHCEGRQAPPHPQSPPVPSLFDPGELAAVEVSSVSEESDEEEEESLTSVFLKTLNGKHRHYEQDFTILIDHFQSFKELPKLLDCGLREGAALSAASRTDRVPGEKGKEGHGQGTGNMDVQISLPQRQAESDQQDSPPVTSSKQQTSKSNLSSRRASSQPTTLHVHPSSSNSRLEVEKSPSSSLSSLGEITTSDRRSSKLQTGTRRVLSQDGIISPETDSGFVGSESSHLTPAAAPSPLHQRASESVSVPQEVNSGKPQTGPVSALSPGSSPSHRLTALDLSGGSQRRSRHAERRHTFSCSPQRWVRQTDQTRADSGTSEFGLESDCSHTVSEEGHSDHYASFHSSCPTAQRHHGDCLKALRSSQVANRNDAIQTLQAEVTRLKDRLESCLKNKEPLSSVRAAPPAQEKCTHQNTSTPLARSGERWRDVSGGGSERWTVDEAEESTQRQRARKISATTHRHTPQADNLTGSELKPSTPRPQPSTPRPQARPQPQPQVSRCTQTSEAAPESRCSHTNTVRSRRTQTRQDPGVCVSEPADEPDSRRGQAPLCPQCLSRRREQSERPVGFNKEPTHSPSCLRHCPLCGLCFETYRRTEPDRRRDSDSPTHTSHRPTRSLDRAARHRYVAAEAPPALLQCKPVCSVPLLLYSGHVMNSYSPPLCMSPSNSTGTTSGVRGRGEVRGRKRRSLSVDKQRSMDSSLDRAIRAARYMKQTSRRMARSLASGLQYQELLSQSCSY